jgi:hypothetical protein
MALLWNLIDRDEGHFEPALPSGLRDLHDGDLLYLHYRRIGAES